MILGQLVVSRIAMRRDRVSKNALSKRKSLPNEVKIIVTADMAESSNLVSFRILYSTNDPRCEYQQVHDANREQILCVKDRKSVV